MPKERAEEAVPPDPLLASVLRGLGLIFPRRDGKGLELEGLSEELRANKDAVLCVRAMAPSAAVFMT
jgi:hypothetical protein